MARSTEVADLKLSTVPSGLQLSPAYNPSASSKVSSIRDCSRAVESLADRARNRVIARMNCPGMV
jgi:hypothetical protein